MNAPLTSKTVVQEVFALNPQVVRVFVRNRMDCLGCWLQRFCTMEDAAVSYDLSVDSLLEEIHQEINPAQRREE